MQLKNCINHIDFLEVARGESFVAHVPVHLIGEADCAWGARTKVV